MKWAPSFAFGLWLIMHKYSITGAVYGIPRSAALLIIIAIKRNVDKILELCRCWRHRSTETQKSNYIDL